MKPLYTDIPLELEYETVFYACYPKEISCNFYSYHIQRTLIRVNIVVSEFALTVRALTS